MSFNKKEKKKNDYHKFNLLKDKDLDKQIWENNNIEPWSSIKEIHFQAHV